MADVKRAWFRRIGYVPHPPQWQYHDSQARFRTPVCGRRFGKSTMAARDIEPHLFTPNKRFWIVGPTYDLAEKEFRVVWDDLIVKLALGREKRIRKAYNKKQGDMYIELPWQTRIEVRSADHPEFLVGEALDGAIMSEAAKQKKETWERFIRPSLADRRGWATFPTTPEGFNWLHDLWQLGANPELPDYECVDTETEILTKRGWLRYDQLHVGDETLSINPTTGLSEWDVVQKVNTYDNVSTLVRMESHQFSALTTTNHRWLVNSKVTTDGRRGGWRWKTTDTLAMIDGVPKAVPHGQLPTEAKYTDAFVELVAWIWTEGSKLSTGEFSIHQSHVVYPENVARIRATLMELCPNPVDGRTGSGGYWSERQRDGSQTEFYLGAEISREFWQVFSRHKVVGPEFILGLTRAQLQLFINVSQLGDGLGNQKGVGQADIEQLQAFQMACCLLGLPTSIRSNGEGLWKLLIGSRSVIRPKQAEYNARGTGGMRITREPYGGTVWCPRTRNGNWLARRSGSVYYTGNSWKFPSWANTAVYPGGRDDPEIKLLEATTVKEWFEQEIGADFASFVGKILVNWDEYVHVKPHVFRPDWPNYMAFDWGFTNPLAAVEFQVSPWDTIHVWRQHYKQYWTLERHVAFLKERGNPEGYRLDLAFGDAADPAAAVYVSEHLVGCIADPEAKKKHMWGVGINLINNFMKADRERRTESGLIVATIDEYGTPAYEPGYFVDPVCTDVIREHNNYRSKAPIKGQNVPEMAQNIEGHTIDAIRYALVQLFHLGVNHHLDEIYGPQNLSLTTPAATVIPGSAVRERELAAPQGPTEHEEFRPWHATGADGGIFDMSKTF